MEMEDQLKLLLQQHVKALQSCSQTPTGWATALSVCYLKYIKKGDRKVVCFGVFFPVKEAANSINSQMQGPSESAELF